MGELENSGEYKLISRASKYSVYILLGITLRSGMTKYTGLRFKVHPQRYKDRSRRQNIDQHNKFKKMNKNKMIIFQAYLIQA